jgi:dihydrofolate reductase
VAGGGEVYRAAMALADRIYLTRVGGEWAGDVTFPAVDPAQWRVVRRELFDHGADFLLPFEFVDYERA